MGAMVSCQPLSVAEGEFLHAIWMESSRSVSSRASGVTRARPRPDPNPLKPLPRPLLWQRPHQQRSSPLRGRPRGSACGRGPSLRTSRRVARTESPTCPACTSLPAGREKTPVTRARRPRARASAESGRSCAPGGLPRRRKKTRGSRPGDGSPRLLWCVAKSIGILPDRRRAADASRKLSLRLPSLAANRCTELSAPPAGRAPAIAVSCDMKYRLHGPGIIPCTVSKASRRPNRLSAESRDADCLIVPQTLQSCAVLTNRYCSTMPMIIGTRISKGTNHW
jgi:hypothetical protein